MSTSCSLPCSESVRIHASWRVGSLVTSEEAEDHDLGPAGQLSYAITSGNEEQFFRIDETGDIFVASSPLLPGQYRLTITVWDHGTPPLSVSGLLTVTVDAVGQVDCVGNDDYGARSYTHAASTRITISSCVSVNVAASLAVDIHVT